MTLKDWKAMHVVGARMRTIEHWIERYRNTTRTITKVQGNGYWFKFDGSDQRSFSQFPKRSELQFHEDGSFTVAPEGLRERNGQWRLVFVGKDGDS